MEEKETNRRIVLLTLLLLLSMCPHGFVISVPARTHTANVSNGGTTKISNDILDVHVKTTTPDFGTYTVSTGPDHPNPGQDVFKGGAAGDPGSSYNTIWVYDTGNEYITANDPSISSSSGRGCSPPWGGSMDTHFLDEFNPMLAVTPNMVSITWSPTLENYIIRQDIEIMGTTLVDTYVRVTMCVQNHDSERHQLEIRYLWDLMIDGVNGPWLRPWTNADTPQTWLDEDQKWFDGVPFQFWETTNYPTNLFSIYGSISEPSTLPIPATPPSFMYADWDKAYHVAHCPIPITGATIGGADSSVVYYWYPPGGYLNPGEEYCVTAYIWPEVGDERWGGQVRFRGTVTTNEQWGDFVCYGSYYCDVKATQIISDPNNTLTTGTTVTVCYDEQLSLTVGEEVECYGYYYKWGGPMQCVGYVDCRQDPYYVIRKPVSEDPVHNIDTGLDYKTIQEAIDAFQTLDGHTILVDAGVYYEHVAVHKSLSLIGENKATIIDGSSTGTVVNVTANNVHITSFTIQNPGRSYIGIVLYSNENDVSDNNVHGISLKESSNNTISGNNISESISESIFRLYKSDGNTIVQNMITKSSAGIYIYSSGNNFLRDNSMVDNDYNFGVFGTVLSSFINDIDTSNTVNGKPVYYWVNEHDRQVPSEAGYVGIVNSTGIIVRGLTLSENFQGVLFAHTKDSKIENVHVLDNYEGIGLVASESNIITGNTATNNAGGIDLLFSEDNTITENMLTDSALDGILLGYSDGNVLVDNSLVNSYRTGFRVWGSSHNTIRSNAITNTTGAGMSILYGSYNNTIYHNNFIDNTNQVIIDAEYPSKNTWDDGYPSGGNYWSDYEERYPDAEELDGSGIWNTPYVLDNNNQDNYPLMNPYVRVISTDLNGDGTVNIIDVSIVAVAFATEPGDENWNEIADLDNNQVINIVDVATVAVDYGKTY